MFYCVQHKWSSETIHCPTCNPKQDENEKQVRVTYDNLKGSSLVSFIDWLFKNYTLIKK